MSNQSNSQTTPPSERVMHIGELRAMIIEQLPMQDQARFVTINHTWHYECVRSLWGSESMQNWVPIHAFKTIPDQLKDQYSSRVRRLLMLEDATRDYVVDFWNGRPRLFFPRLKHAMIHIRLNRRGFTGRGNLEDEKLVYSHLLSPALKTLSLQRWPGSEEGLMNEGKEFPIDVLASRAVNLTEFRVSGITQFVSITLLLKRLLKLKTVKILCLSGHPPGHQFREFIRHLRTVKARLDQLHLDFGFDVSDPTFLVPPERLPTKISVKHLSVRNIYEGEIPWLLHCIDPDDLVKLELDSPSFENWLDPESLGGSAMPDYPNLKYLTIRSITGVGAVGWTHIPVRKDLLLYISTSFPELEELRFEDHLGMFGFSAMHLSNTALADVFGRMPNLRVFSIDGDATENHLWTSDGLEPLWDICPKLERLQLVEPPTCEPKDIPLDMGRKDGRVLRASIGVFPVPSMF